MKRRGRSTLLLSMSMLLLLATKIHAAAVTTEVHHGTTSTTVKTPLKSEPSVSITTGLSSNQPEVTTDSTGLDDIQDDKLPFVTKQERMEKILGEDDKSLLKELPRLAQPILNPKEILQQEINKLGDEGADQKIQEEIAKVIKAQAQRARPELSPSTAPSVSKSTTAAEGRAMKDLLQAETDVQYSDDLDEDDDDDDDDDDLDNYDEEDEDDELVMTHCPDYCRCAGQYAAATTARCSKLIDNQSFGSSIAHLMIENAGEIRLGPHALISRGLDHLETLTIVNTRISEIHRTAFDGVKYLFAVNLTHNGAIDIHHDTFENNTQLSLLTVAGHPFSPEWLESSPYLFNATSVTEFDFSDNLIEFLPVNAFTKMPKLAYLNLKGNRLSRVTKEMFAPLNSLVELDLSENSLHSLPLDLFDGIELQSLRMANNLLVTLNQTIRALDLNFLDVSQNQIKIIAKDDLINLPALEHLVVSSNGLKRIHQHAFSQLTSLDHLDISHNKLTQFTEHHLRNNPRLQILLMSDNPDLVVLPVFKLHGYEYNTFSIFRFECANCGLEGIENGTFNAMPALTKLNLANNRISSLPEGTFDVLTSLRVLDLSDNLINTIPANMFRGAVSLGKMSLAGNPLTTLQVTPFLMTGELSHLDVSRCQLRRVWSEARQPFKSLRFLSVRGNELERITTEELKATPKLSGLDLFSNPLSCDTEFNDAVQYLVSHGITPMETLRYVANLDSDNFAEASEGISRWSDLAKLVCEDEFGGIPPRRLPSRRPTMPAEPNDVDASEISKDDIENNLFDMPIHTIDHGPRIDEDAEEAWSELDKSMEYDDLYSMKQRVYHWYNHRAIWPALTVILVALAALIIVIQFARYMSNRGGRGPVIRPPLILRQGLIDNKNCGLVYKPLQEEIATPQMPKRGSCYSSSTFHYDKIVPESV